MSKERTYEQWLDLVRSNSDEDAFQYVPEHLKTQEMCDIAVKKHPRNFEYVPEKFITQEMCDSIVEDEADAIKYVPEKFKTQETKGRNMMDKMDKKEKKLYKEDAKKKFPELLFQNKGTIFETCNQLGISTSSFYVWCNQDPEFKKKCKEAQYRLVNKAELMLWEQMMNGDTKAIIHFLRCKGRRMGYDPSYDSQYNDVEKDF